ncbi:hypothetical protein CYLTODRAFT_424661 [Cylindrobasidium torrendii FP15055 ss-10]|uniref:choline-phosphate cytidylyltransferase n=1 Tax=Cylindrobasidium torrendii FP15055 ss-10 TaxID=1314674 RepID=A0A0D7B3B8_9AGAR|nr:hypothetical protein CYLTODRAFT_424661 [Cylindrobasidium torrendii FP15055 ss-10]
MDAASVMSDDDYDVISSAGLESSMADLNMFPRPPSEPQPQPDARAKWLTASLEAEDIQQYTRTMLEASGGGTTASGSRRQSFAEQRTRRVYVDGVFDVFSVGDALQLRQAKLAFPAVHLIVGVFDDTQCRQHGVAPAFPQIERCEVLRHCRWVDEVITDAPWRIDDAFLSRRRIDYVAFDEGATVDPKYDLVRVKGFDDIKRSGKVIVTRKTNGLTNPQLSPTSLHAHVQHVRFTSTTPTPAQTKAPRGVVDDLEDTNSPPQPLPLPLAPAAAPTITSQPAIAPPPPQTVSAPNTADKDYDDEPPADFFL